MKTGLSVGIVGAGSISRYHLNAYLQKGVRLKAIADHNLKNAKWRADEYGVEKIFTDYRCMLEDCPELDAVSVCVPNKFHAQVTIDCLNAGKHVLCEKPPALNAKEAVKMQATAETTGKILMYDFNNRARSASQALWRYIKSGELGRINSAQAKWTRRQGIPGFGGWFTQKALAGGGPVMDLLHMLDLALYFMGYPEPEWVLAQTFNDFADNPNFKGPWGFADVEGGIVDVETAAHAFIRFKSGQVLFTRNSWAEQIKREVASVSLQGTKGGGMMKTTFEKDGVDETSLVSCEIYTMKHGHPVNYELIRSENDPKMGRELSVKHFVNVVLGKEEPLNTPREAITLMKIIDAIYKSAARKEPLKP